MNHYEVYLTEQEIRKIDADNFLLKTPERGNPRLIFFLYGQDDEVNNIAIFNWNNIIGFRQILKES